MITSCSDRPGTSTPCHSDSVPNRQVASSSANRLISCEVGSSPWQSSGKSIRLAQLGRGLPGRAHRGEQPERAAPGRGDELLRSRRGTARAARRGPAAAGASPRTGSRCAGGRTASRRRCRTRPSGAACRSSAPSLARPDSSAGAGSAGAGLGGPSLGQAPLVRQRHERAADRQRGRGQRHRPAAEHALRQQPAHLQRRHPQRGRAARVALGGLVQPHHVGPGRDVRAERVEDPLGRVVHLVERGQRGPPRGQLLRLILGLLGAGPDVRGAAARGVADRGQRRGQGLGHHVDPPAVAPRRGPARARGRRPRAGRGALVDLAAGPAGGRLHGRGRQLGGRHRGHPVDQVVRLVDDHDVVLGQHEAVLQRVDREQGVVGDHDVGLARPPPGPARRSTARRTGSAGRRCTPGR